MCTLTTMDDLTMNRPLVLVPASILDDLLELARLAADRIGEDPLANALRGSTAEVRCSLLMEP